MKAKLSWGDKDRQGAEEEDAIGGLVRKTVLQPAGASQKVQTRGGHFREQGDNRSLFLTRSQPLC